MLAINRKTPHGGVFLLTARLLKVRYALLNAFGYLVHHFGLDLDRFLVDQL